MSRIGRKPIPVPAGVKIALQGGQVDVQGPKGKLTQAFPTGINFSLADGHLVAKRASEDPELAKFHGLARSLVANAVAGVTEDDLPPYWMKSALAVSDDFQCQCC